MWRSDGQSCSQESCSFPGILRARSVKAPAPRTGSPCWGAVQAGCLHGHDPSCCALPLLPYQQTVGMLGVGEGSLCVSRSPPRLLSLAHLGACVQAAAVLAPVAPCASRSCGTPALHLLVRMGKEGETCSACTHMPKLDPEPKSGSVGLSDRLCRGPTWSFWHRPGLGGAGSAGGAQGRCGECGSEVGVMWAAQAQYGFTPPGVSAVVAQEVVSNSVGLCVKGSPLFPTANTDTSVLG